MGRTAGLRDFFSRPTEGEAAFRAAHRRKLLVRALAAGAFRGHEQTSPSRPCARLRRDFYRPIR